jgi:hypothetical protein
MTTAAPTTSVIDDLRARITAVQARFTEIGLRAARAAADLAVVGTPPSERLVAELAAAAAEFQALRDEVLESVATLEVVLPKPANTIRSLRDLLAVVDVLAATHPNVDDRHRRHDAARAAVMHVIDRVQAIVHDDDPSFAPLIECQAWAHAMHDEIVGTEATDADVLAWAERLRPFAALLEMLEGGADDGSFAKLADGVAAAFGQPLASAAMRGHLQLR